ncbi:glycoside hydrolase family 36 protein [Cellulomonas sp. McL0617]|uniref:glycoside hydrolase family 36 protein n=1 Tax=Cellulomonas sp. McL0617 TaxID=3415675 RepID=UPI003CF3A3E0
MTDAGAAQEQILTLWDGPDGMHLVCRPGSAAALVGGDRATEGDNALIQRAVQPLVEILAVGYGRHSGNIRHTATTIGASLRVVEMLDGLGSIGREVVVVQSDAVTGLRVRVVLQVEAHTVRARTIVRNDGTAALVLQAVSSLAVSAPAGRFGADEVVSIEGYSDWLGESRWTRSRLDGNDGLVRLDLAAHQHQDGRGARIISSASTWSSGSRMPAGVLAEQEDGTALAWQVEHNGAWRVEIGARLDTAGTPVLAVVLLGPNDTDHAWQHALAPGEEFETVPVSVVSASTGWQGAIAALTDHRRALRGPSGAGAWVVFNDYMNTLMGDPTTDKLLPLVDAAAAAGAEVFCIDAGWYDDSGDWWDFVGAWEPSVNRFPGGGLAVVVDHIRERGMVPGLWLEPEVVGVRSPVSNELPDEAFLLRAGRRVVEHDRYFLDLRHEASIKRLDAVVDRLVDEFGIGYFKLDYNVIPGSGTDHAADSAGDGLLQHNRAHLAWLDGVRSRHPEVLIENCASGGMRSDFAMLSRTDLQSTSDQQNPLLYPPIASGALMSISPEQAANWAYPQPEMSDEEIIFTLCTGLSGRLYLSGHLDAMNPDQLALVRAGVDIAQRERSHVERSVPVWPLGLPRWDDPWVASGLKCEASTLVTVWFRGGAQQSIVLDVPAGAVSVVFPDSSALPRPGADWSLTRLHDGTVRVETSTSEPQARILRITPAHTA